MPVDLFSWLDADGIGIVQGDQTHLHAPGSEQDPSGGKMIPVFCFPDLHGADPVQPLGVHGGKAGGHMLGDHNAGGLCRKIPDDFQDCLSAASGGSYGDHGRKEMAGSGLFCLCKK